MRKLLDLMKTPLIIPIIFVIMYCIVYVHTQLPRYSRENIDTFDEIREEFYLLNDYILSEYEGVDPDDMNIISGKGYFSLLYNYDDVEDKTSKELATVIRRIMYEHGCGSMRVEISDDWVAYGLIAANRYVFSLDGSFPYKSYNEKRNIRYHCYVLKDDWYYFDALLR